MTKPLRNEHLKKYSNSLLQQDAVFLSILVGTLLISAGLSAFLILGNRLWEDICIRPECFNNVLVIFDVPIKVATAGVALAGLYALVFRSRQTALQIETAENALEEASRNNTYANYRAHKAEVFDEFDRIAEKRGFSVVQKNGLYRELFPLNGPQYFAHEGSVLNDGEQYAIARLIENYHNILDAIPTSRLKDNAEIVATKKHLAVRLLHIFNQIYFARTPQPHGGDGPGSLAVYLKEDVVNGLYQLYGILSELHTLSMLSEDVVRRPRLPSRIDGRDEVLTQLETPITA